MLWKNKLVPILFALAGVLFLVPTVKSVIKGQPLNLPYFILSLVFLVFGVVGGRKSPVLGRRVPNKRMPRTRLSVALASNLKWTWREFARR